MTHILLINSDKPEPIRFFKEYKNNHDIQLTVLTRKRYASIYDDFADRVYGVDDITDLSLSRLLIIEIFEKESIDYIITPTEKSVLTGGYLRSFFALPGPSFETTLCMTNKLAMKTKLFDAGIPVANFMRLDRLEDIPKVGEKLGWPMIVKPVMGSGTLNTFIIESSQDVHEPVMLEKLNLLKKSKVPILAEEYIEMEEYHCDSLFYNGKLIFISISKYFSPLLKAESGIVGSYIINEENPIYKKIIEINEAVVNTFCVSDGPTHMELFHTTTGELLVGEIALRVGGGGISETISKKYGISMWDSSLHIAMNQNPQLEKVTSKGIFGWCSLPCRNGIIKDFTPLEVLLEIPGVIDVHINYQSGEYVEEKEKPRFYFGKVYFCLDREDQLEVFLNIVQEKFFLNVEPFNKV